MRYTVLVMALVLAGCGPSPQKSLSFKATAHSVTLSWTQGTLPSGASAITGNNVYRGTTSGAETLLTSLSTPSVSYVDTAVTAGSVYYYEVTAVNSAGESGRSNEVAATVPNPQVPNAPVLGNPTVVSTTAPCVGVPLNAWTNITIPAQTSNFEIQMDVTPSAANMDGVLGLAGVKAGSDNNLAVPVLFSTAGTIQMMNGAFPYPASTVTYGGGSTYHLTLDVNTTSHTYNGFVGGTSRTQVANNFAWRSAAGNPASLGFVGALQDVGAGTLNVCNVTILSYPMAS